MCKMQETYNRLRARTASETTNMQHHPPQENPVCPTLQAKLNTPHCEAAPQAPPRAEAGCSKEIAGTDRHGSDRSRSELSSGGITVQRSDAGRKRIKATQYAHAGAHVPRRDAWVPRTQHPRPDRATPTRPREPRRPTKDRDAEAPHGL